MVNGQRTTCGSWFSSSNYMDLRDPTALVMSAFAGLALSPPHTHKTRHDIVNLKLLLFSIVGGAS